MWTVPTTTRPKSRLTMVAVPRPDGTAHREDDDQRVGGAPRGRRGRHAHASPDARPAHPRTSPRRSRAPPPASLAGRRPGAVPRGSSAPYGSVGGCVRPKPPMWAAGRRWAVGQALSSKSGESHPTGSSRASTSSTGTPSRPSRSGEVQAVERCTFQSSSETSQSSPRRASKASTASSPSPPLAIAGCQNAVG